MNDQCRISTIEGLLDCLYVPRGGEKLEAVLVRHPPSITTIVCTYSDEARPSYVRSKQSFPVDDTVFTQALSLGYVTRRNHDCRQLRLTLIFRLSEAGEAAHQKNALQEELSKLLYPGKGMRVCDLEIYLQGHSAEAIESALETLVLTGTAVRYDNGGQTFYLLELKPAA